MRLKKPFVIIGSIILLPFLPIILWITIGSARAIFFRLIGHPVDKEPRELAREIVEKGQDATRCRDLEQAMPTMGPTLTEKRMNCIYEVASLRKDASACELLLPSRYAMSCIGAAEDWPYGPCHMTSTHQLMCNLPGDSNDQKYYDIDQLENCTAYTRYGNPQVVSWCFAERANMYGDLEPCLKFAKTDEEKDTCRYQRATYIDNFRIDICQEITNDSKRIGCITEIKAWIKYPELLPEEN